MVTVCWLHSVTVTCRRPKAKGVARQITQSRLAGQGLRTLSLDNPEHVERYGLQQLAAERTSLAG
jgi:hypothetical protein